MQEQSGLLQQNSESSHHEEQQSSSPLEKLIEKVDGEGKYQKHSFIIFCIMWFLTAWLLLGMNFFFDDSYTCKSDELVDQDKCQAYVCSLEPEQRPDAIKEHASSIVFQFDPFLICPDYQNTVSILQDMMFVGAIFGFFVIPYIADNFGRRLAMRIAWGIGTISVLLTCIADSHNMIGIGLFLVGFGTNPAITLCFSFINEVCLGKSRQQYGVGVQVAWAIGQTTIALVFLTGLSWKAIMFILLGLFFVGSVSVELFLLETPMFLLKKHPEAAIAILNKMAKINGKEQLQQADLAELDHNEEKLDIYPEQKGLSFTDLFKYKSIRWISISTAMIFFAIQAIYYSSTLNESSVGFTKTINQIVFGISQTLGYLSAELLIHRCSRRKSTFIGLGVSFLLCLALGFMVMAQNDSNKDLMKWLQTIALMFSRFGLCCFWSIFYIYVAQLFPTEVRSIGFGWTSVVGMIGSTISPFVKSIAQTINLNSWFPPALFGLLCWFFTFCLPQTFGHPLKDTIEERIQVLIKQKSDLDFDEPDDDDEMDTASDYNPKSSTLIYSDWNAPPIRKAHSVDQIKIFPIQS